MNVSLSLSPPPLSPSLSLPLPIIFFNNISLSCGGGDRVVGLPGPLNLGGGCGSDGLLFLLPLDLGLL